MRSVRLTAQLYDAAVLRWPDAVLASGVIPTRAAIGWPLHRVSFAADATEILESTGPGNGDVAAGMALSHLLYVSAAPGGGAWTADLLRYRLTRWTAAGTRGAVLERAPSWFAGPSRMTLGGPDAPPPPSIAAVQEDSLGRLWVFTNVPAPGWRDAWASVSRGAREVETTQIAVEELYRTMIEVIDPRAGRVVFRRVSDDWIVAALPGVRSVAYRVDGNGVPRLHVLALSLRTP